VSWTNVTYIRLRVAKLGPKQATLDDTLSAVRLSVVRLLSSPLMWRLGDLFTIDVKLKTFFWFAYVGSDAHFTFQNPSILTEKKAAES
jgi:hypothetical protein